MKKLFLTLLVVLLPMLLQAAQTSGSCGDNLRWNYNSSTKTLSIIGTGPMTNYSLSSYEGNGLAPWYSYIDEISMIELPSGITSIGDYAFFQCRQLKSVTIPGSVTCIGNYAFKSCGNLNSLILSNGIVNIGDEAFCMCNSLLSVSIPSSIESISTSAFDLCNALKTIVIPDKAIIIGAAAFGGSPWVWNQPEGPLYANKVFYFYRGTMPSNTELKLAEGTLTIADYAFQHCDELISITIPSSIVYIGKKVFKDCTNLSCIYVAAATPPTAFDDSFINYEADLFVPAPSIDIYKSTAPWSNFASIKALPDVQIQMNNNISTYCSNSALDFTNVSGLKAYIASGHNNNTGKVMLSRIYDVPAGTGVILMGETGSYNVPVTVASSSYSNYLKGVTTATTITPTSDGYNNYILANGTNGIGFYPVGEEGTLAAGKAYLQLPSSVSSAKGFTLSFEDETTGISDNYEVEIMNSDAAVYDLQGRKVKNPTKGLYIINGKKVVIK